jgi:ABC-type sugar transport system permease subunit
MRFWQRRAFRLALTGWLFALPLLIYFIIWSVIPILSALTLLFFDWKGFEDLSTIHYVGLANVKELLSDRDYLRAFGNTFRYAVVVVTGSVGLGLALALAVNGVTRLVSLVRVIYYLPVVLPGTAMALLWRLLYQPRYGMFNQFLRLFGAPPIAWLMNTKTALLAVCAYVIWKGVGWYMVVLLAGLKAIPEEYYEAARIDGANRWQEFQRITLPLLKPALLFVTTMSIIWSLQVFNAVFVMTGGGPIDRTNTVVLQMYNTAFQWFRTSYATSMAVGLFVVIFIITRIQMRLYGEGGWSSYMG